MLAANRKVVPTSPSAPAVLAKGVSPAKAAIEIPKLKVSSPPKNDEVVEEIELIPEIPTLPLEPIDDAEPKPAASAVTMLMEDNVEAFLNGQSAKGDAFDKYRKMLKCGLPSGAVLQKMKQDGVASIGGEAKPALDASLAAKVAAKPKPASGPNFMQEKPTSCSTGVVQSSSECTEEFLGGVEPCGDGLDKYRKMLKCGLPRGAVEQKMRQDGVNLASLGHTTSSVQVQETTTRKTLDEALKSALAGTGKSVTPQTTAIDGQNKVQNIAVETLPQKDVSSAVPEVMVDVAKDAIKLEIDASISVDTVHSSQETFEVDKDEAFSMKPMPSLVAELKGALDIDGNSAGRSSVLDSSGQVDFEKLITELRSTAGVATFGDLHARCGIDKLVGVLMKAKKRFLLDYAGEMLYRGKDDKVVITLDEENATRFLRNEATVARPRTNPLPAALSPFAKKLPPKLSPRTPTEPSKTEATTLLQPKDVPEHQFKVGNGASTDIAADPVQVSKKSAPIGEPETQMHEVATASSSAQNLTVAHVIPSVQEAPNNAPTPIAVITEATSNECLPPPMLQIAVSEMTSPKDGPPQDIALAEVVEATSEPQPTNSVTAVLDENEDENITGRGPPPMPPASPEQVERMRRSSSRSPNRRKTGSFANRPRSPSKKLPEESMFDMFGRRRSSGTVYRVALNVMDSKSVETIPRDAITDALNWTAEEDNQKDIFSFENAQGLEMAKMMEKLATSPSKRKLEERSASFVTREKMRNQTQAAVLLQRVMRGWITRMKYRSCLWVRDRLNSAVQSRLPEKVEEALAASRAIATKFVRPPEHECAVASLDTIREERALRAKLLELSESPVDSRDLVRRFASVVDRLKRCRLSDPYAFKDEVSKKAELVYEAAHSRVDMCMKLQQACNGMRPSEMMEALRQCDAAASKYVGVWEEKFLEKEKNQIRTVLVAIQHEEPAILGLLKECVSPEIIQHHPEMIFQRTNFDELEKAIAKAVEDLGCSPVSPGATQILSLASTVLSLRKSLIAQASLKSASWNVCEKLLGDARAKMKAWLTAVGVEADQPSKSLDYHSKWFTSIEQELDMISGELDKKAGVADIIEALKDSVARCDLDDIRNVLRKGEKRGLQERVHDVELQQTLQKAHQYLEQFSLIHARLQEVLSGVNRSPSELKRVADEARKVVLPHSTDARLVDECDRLCALGACELSPAIQKALQVVPDRKELEKLVDRVRKSERMGGMPELVSVEDLLAMEEFRLVQEQLRGATRMHDEKRKTELTIKFRQLHLEHNPAQFRFHNFSDLKDAKDWSLEASGRRIFPGNFGRRETRAARMLYASRTPIHAPLTKAPEADVKLKRFAIKANRTLLAYAGDLEVDDLTEFGGDLCQGLHELLVFALAEKSVRDEVYCQIMKHLTENRRPGSITRTWNVLAFCLVTFPPSQCLDMFVECFIRAHAPAADMQSLLDKLHYAVFVGERPVAPTLGDIKSRQDDGGLVEGLGWKATG